MKDNIWSCREFYIRIFKNNKLLTDLQKFNQF